MPNNHLDLPTPIHHTCITVLSPGAQPRLATGTLSGHVRVYDARQRKAVSEWRVAREGGMGAVEAGGHEQCVWREVREMGVKANAARNTQRALL